MDVCDARDTLAAAIGSPTKVRVLDNIIVDYAFIDRKIAVRILIEARPVYTIRGYLCSIPTYIALTPIKHNGYDVLIELWHARDWPRPPTYIADYDEILEMSADLLPDNMDEMGLHASKSLTHILGFELGVDGTQCPMLIKMINTDLDLIIHSEGLFTPRPAGIQWPPTADGLNTIYHPNRVDGRLILNDRSGIDTNDPNATTRQ